MVTVIIGLAIGYLGPFGSFEMPMHRRLLYWVILIGSGHLIYFQIGNVFDWFFSDKKIHPFVAFILPSLLAAVLLSFVVSFVSELFFTTNLNVTTEFLIFFPKVFILGLILNLLGYLIDNLKHKQNAESNSEQSQIQAIIQHPFLDRIPQNLGSDLICFMMEDHYLRVYTEKGDHMMLLRMKDALVELKEYPGFQVHRSWWIATDAITEVKKQNRKVTLIMNNDMEVPVSQKYLPILKTADLI